MAKKKNWRGGKTSPGGAFVAGTIVERARTPGAAGRCFAL
jgi:hypothetical protein